jgi:hypothetical protein
LTFPLVDFSASLLVRRFVFLVGANLRAASENVVGWDRSLGATDFRHSRVGFRFRNAGEWSERARRALQRRRVG